MLFRSYLRKRKSDRYASPNEMSRAERHSKRVIILKKVIFYLLLAFVAAVLITPMITKNWRGYKINFQSNEKAVEQPKDNIASEKEVPVMKKPRFFGYDDNGQPYNIKAINGISVDEKRIVLTEIDGSITLKDNSKISLRSDQGDYIIEKKEISLNGGVIIDIDKGYRFKTSSAYIKLKENMATGSEKVEISGIMGDITSDNGFTIRNSGEEILFYGGVELNGDIEKIRKVSESEES